MNDQIVEYIRQNRDTYTRYSINRELEQQGYNMDEIDAAWATFEMESAKPERVWFSGSFWIAWAGFLLGIPIAIGIITRIFWILFTPEAAFWAFVSLSAIALIGAIIITIITWSNPNYRGVARGLLTALAITVLIPFVPLIIIIGICQAGQTITFGSTYTPTVIRPIVTPVPFTPTPSSQIIINELASIH